MKIEFEVRAFGTVEGTETEYTNKSTELVQVKEIPKTTRLAELESMLTALLDEVESGFAKPEQCLGKITIRVKKDQGKIISLG